ncbi:hypothetical protein D3C76_1120660 [compost metagenome]
MGGEPVVQPHGVGAGGKRLGEGQACTAMAHVLDQCLGTGHANAFQGFGEVDRLAVLAQPHENGHLGAGAAYAQLDAVDLPVEGLRGVQLAGEQLVAQGGPGGLTLQVQGQAIGLGEALGGGDYQGSRVGQGHEAQVEHALLRCIASRDPGHAVRASGVLVVRHLGCHLSAKWRRSESAGAGRNRRHRHQLAPPLE